MLPTLPIRYAPFSISPSGVPLPPLYSSSSSAFFFSAGLNRLVSRTARVDLRFWPERVRSEVGLQADRKEMASEGQGGRV